MVWIFAFALLAATVYTLLSLPDYVLRMWRGNQSIVRSAMARLKLTRTAFGELQAFANDYPDNALQDEIDEVIEHVRLVANPTITNIHEMTHSDIWKLPIAADASWSLGSAEFWNYWQPIWQMRQDARLIEQQVTETERYVNVLEALCARLSDESIAIYEEPAPDDELDEQINFPVREEPAYVDEDLQEIATAFKFSLRQESMEPVLDQIEGERVQGMQIPALYARGLALQQSLASLEEAAWEEDIPTQTILDEWLERLDEWREEKEALANEVEIIQRRRVEHERNVRRVETKLDEFVVREGESDLSELAYDLLSLSDRQLLQLEWESSADAIQIATAITNGLPNMRAIDQNARALKQRIPKTSGAVRAKLTEAVTRHREWRTLLDHALDGQEDMLQWLRTVLADVTQAMAEKPAIIQLLNEAVQAQKTQQDEDGTTAAIVAEMWKLWDKVDGYVLLDDHQLIRLLRDMPSDAAEIPDDLEKRTTIRNRAHKIVQTLQPVSADLQAWGPRIEQDLTGFAKSRSELLEPASLWQCLQDEIAQIEGLITAYKQKFQKPQFSWLLEKREPLQKARQTAIERIRQEMRELYLRYESLQNEAERIRTQLEAIDDEEKHDAIVIELDKAQQMDDIADVRMALQSMKYALGR